MKIILFGANGFIGRRILQRLCHTGGHNIVACSLHPDILPTDGYEFREMDALNSCGVNNLLEDFHPDIIINASALSVVDYCEQHQEEAYAINVTAVRNLAEYCQRHDSRLIHLSTDFVFDGTLSIPYTESDTPNPVNHYGKTKQWAEDAIREICPNHAIMRVEVVYGTPLSGQHGNIVQLVKSRLASGQSIRVVSDQFRSPTWVEDIVIATEALLSNRNNGTYHICGNEVMSVADIAHRVAKHFHLDTSLIQAVTTKELDEATPRPIYTPMSTEKASKHFGYHPHTLEEALALMTSTPPEK